LLWSFRRAEWKKTKLVLAQVLRVIHPLVKNPDDVDRVIGLREKRNARADQHAAVTRSNAGGGLTGCVLSVIQ
jgi:hypothetical protein